MKRLWFTVLPVLLLLAPIAFLGQQPNPVRVCVVGRDFRYPPPVTKALNSTPEIRYQRDSVTKYVNQHKSSANNLVTIEAVALKLTNLANVTNDADAVGCAYLVTVWSIPVMTSDAEQRNSRPASDFVLGNEGFPPPNPLNLSIMRSEAAGWWNSLPDASYNSSKKFAQAIADEVYATVLKHP